MSAPQTVPWTSPPTCSPASTTSASPCPTSTRRSRCTGTRSGWRSSTRRPTRSRASARRWWPSATPGSCIQLLAPIDETSTIAKFLDRSGPGLQQLAYRVTDVEQVSAILRERGLRLLYDAPKRGTADSRINFIHPKDAGGVLVELVEPAGKPLRKPHRAGACFTTGSATIH